MKSFPRQSRSRGGGIATVYKSTLGSNITFKTNFDFTHTSFEVVQASITLQHNTLHFFCLYRPPPNRRNNLTDSMFTEQLPDLLDYVNSLPGFVCLVGDMNIHFDNPLQSLTKQTLSTLSLYSLVQVINKFRIMLAFFHCCGRHLAGHLSRIKLCCLLCIAHPPISLTSAWILLGPAVLLSLKLRMAFYISSKDDGSSRFGMIVSGGRSSRKPGSVVWTLCSRLCRYSAHFVRINPLFFIRMPYFLT